MGCELVVVSFCALLSLLLMISQDMCLRVVVAWYLCQMEGGFMASRAGRVSIFLDKGMCLFDDGMQKAWAMILFIYTYLWLAVHT